MKYLGLIGLLLASLAYGSQEEDYPWLESLDPGEGYKESGARLIRLDFGLNPLERFNGKEKILLISVHGSQSEGYEWIYPLQRLDTEKSATFFYRWNDNRCYLSSAEKLDSYLSSAMKNFPDLEKVVLIGHSYGGVLVTSMVQNWNNHLPADIHSVAGPIGSEFNRGGCKYSPPKHISDRVVFYQWKTQKHLDAVFKGLKNDPQDLTLKGSQVTRLPASYRGRRLGHNWSISWVADHLVSNN